jgi:long-chain acyl-CoA synthetase
LKCGGRRVSCKQIEDLLLQCDELVEAAIVPMPDDVLGEAVKAFVVPCKTQSNGLEEHLRAICKTQLPLQLIPKEIVIVRTLPKNNFGKVLKQNLKSLVTTADKLVSTVG